jgi:hypothetical protein
MLIVNNVVTECQNDTGRFGFYLLNDERICRRLTYYSFHFLSKFESYIYYFNHIDKHKHFSNKKQYIEMLNAYHK